MDVIRITLVLIVGIDLTVACIALPIAVYLDLRERSGRQHSMKVFIPMQLAAVVAVIGFWSLAVTYF